MDASIHNKPAILHIGNTASVPYYISRAQRKLGIKSDVLSFYNPPYWKKIDYYYLSKLPFPINRIFRLLWVLLFFRDYDIYHFHYESILFGLDLPLWKSFGKKIIIHYHGTDIRDKKENWFYSKNADLIFVSTPDLLKYSKRARWLPNPIDLDEINKVKEETAINLKILHAPSKTRTKGSQLIVPVLKSIPETKAQIILVTNLEREKLLEVMKGSSVIIDQMNEIGCYGMLSIEAMAMGKTSLCSISEEYLKYFKQIPIIRINNQNLETQIKKILDGKYNLSEIGKQGKKYISRFHDDLIVARKIMHHMRMAKLC